MGTYVVRRPLGSHPGRDVPTHTTREVAEELADDDGIISGSKGRTRGRDVGDHLAVGARLHAAATFAGGNAQIIVRDRARAVVRRGLAVATLGRERVPEERLTAEHPLQARHDAAGLRLHRHVGGHPHHGAALGEHALARGEPALREGLGRSINTYI